MTKPKNRFEELLRKIRALSPEERRQRAEDIIKEMGKRERRRQRKSM